jgi:hypothetical protein
MLRFGGHVFFFGFIFLFLNKALLKAELLEPRSSSNWENYRYDNEGFPQLCDDRGSQCRHILAQSSLCSGL